MVKSDESQTNMTIVANATAFMIFLLIFVLQVYITRKLAMLNDGLNKVSQEDIGNFNALIREPKPGKKDTEGDIEI